MGLIRIGMVILETLFFIGLFGSGIVVMISFVEDIKELFAKDKDEL